MSSLFTGGTPYTGPTTGILYNPAMDPYYGTGLLAAMKASDHAIISGVKDTVRSSSDWYRDTALPWLQERLAQGKDFVADIGSGVNDFLQDLKPDTSPTPPAGSSPPP